MGFSTSNPKRTPFCRGRPVVTMDVLKRWPIQRKAWVSQLGNYRTRMEKVAKSMKIEWEHIRNQYSWVADKTTLTNMTYMPLIMNFISNPLRHEREKHNFASFLCIGERCWSGSHGLISKDSDEIRSEVRFLPGLIHDRIAWTWSQEEADHWATMFSCYLLIYSNPFAMLFWTQLVWRFWSIKHA